jgi:uncharacterized protein (DUF4415 family)
VLNDSPEMTARDFASARQLRDDMPEVVEAFKRSRGRTKIERPKTRVSLRLDPDVVAAYKATGKGWQKRINETLARALVRDRVKRHRANTT